MTATEQMTKLMDSIKGNHEAMWAISGLAHAQLIAEETLENPAIAAIIERPDDAMGADLLRLIIRAAEADGVFHDPANLDPDFIKELVSGAYLTIPTEDDAELSHQEPA